MLTAHQAKVLLKNHKNDLMPVIVGRQTHFELAIGGQTLSMAFESRGKPTGVMFHSDQGCHYTSQQK